MNKFFLGIGGILIVLLSAVFYVGVQIKDVVQSQSHVAGASLSTSRFNKASTTITVAVTASTRILATSTPNPRTYVSICNPYSNVVYIGMDQDKAFNASTTGGIPIASVAGYNSCYEITELNLYTGAIRASSTNEVSTAVNVSLYEITN